jgi:hypothetical protein
MAEAEQLRHGRETKRVGHTKRRNAGDAPVRVAGNAGAFLMRAARADLFCCFHR